MNEQSGARPKRDELPIVEYTRPRCCYCGSRDLHTRRSVTDADGVATRDTRCRSCGGRFFVIAE